MKRKNYRMFWQNVLMYSHEPVSRFNVDVDDLPTYAVKRIAKHMKASLKTEIDRIEIWKSENDQKHHHLHVFLKNPIPFYQTIFARLLAFDDVKRIRLDLIRCGNNQFRLIDYVSGVKFIVPPDIENYSINHKNKMELISNYKLIGII